MGEMTIIFHLIYCSKNQPHLLREMVSLISANILFHVTITKYYSSKPITLLFNFFTQFFAHVKDDSTQFSCLLAAIN